MSSVTSIAPRDYGKRGAASTPPKVRMPADGEDGLFYQSWYPVCLSTEIDDKPRSFSFLDGRVVVWRDSGSLIHVMSAWCAHLGADLGAGDVIGDAIRCPFHHFRYDRQGRCIQTGTGDSVPPNASVYVFPCTEQYGVIWVFNGDVPTWDIPRFPFPEGELDFKIFYSKEFPCDGWVFAANTPDMQHIKYLHGLKFESGDPHGEVFWEEHRLYYRFAASHQGTSVDWEIGMNGSSLYHQMGLTNGWWMGVLTGFSLPAPGKHRAFFVIAVRKQDPAAPELDSTRRLELAEAMEMQVVGEDTRVLDSIRYRIGTLTSGDRTLAKYLQFLRDYPRGHPSANFIK